MSALLKQAQQMQQQLAAAQEQLAATEVTGSAGGELVTVTMTGDGEVTALTIAAIRDARRSVDELAASTMGPLTGGMSLPGF
jgi:DNA-binding protein YbaB